MRPIIVTLFKACPSLGKGFDARVDCGDYSFVAGVSWTRQAWREYARGLGYGRKGNGGCLLREVRYVSAYPRHEALINMFDRTGPTPAFVVSGQQQGQLFAPLAAVA